MDTPQCSVLPLWLRPDARTVLDSMAEYFVVLDRSYNIVFVNRSLAEASRRQYRDLAGRNLWEIWPEMLGTVVQKSYAAAFATGVPQRFEYFHPRNDVWLQADVHYQDDHLLVYFCDTTASKRAEEEREKRYRSLESLLEALPHIAWATDENGVPVSINARWRQYTGLDGDMVAIREAIHPEDIRTVVEENLAVRDQSTPRTYRIRLRRYDGEYRWHVVRAAPMPKDSPVKGYIGTTTDVHEEHLARAILEETEAALRDSVRLQRLVFDAVPACVSYIDGEERYIATNATCARWFGCSTDEIVGLTMRELIGDEAYRLRRPYVERVLGGESVAFESPVRLPSGRTVDAMTHYVPDVRDGEVKGFVSMVQDVTERRNFERALSESAERFRLLVESVPEAAWTATPGGEVDYYNDRWYEYTGAVRGSTGDGSWTRFVHPEDIAHTLAAWERSVCSGEPYEAEVRLRHFASGEYRWFLARARPLRDAQGNITRWFGMTIENHEAKLKQRTLAFLGELAEAKRSLADPEAIMRIATQMLGQHLGASRCAYADVDEEARVFTICGDWAVDVPSAAGVYEVQQFGLRLPAAIRSGQTLAVGDLRAELGDDPGIGAMEAMAVAAMICVPLVKVGRLVAMLAVHQSTPRNWTRDEIALVETVADRCWSSIERAHAERALHQSEAQYRQIAEGLPQLVWSSLPSGEHDYYNQRWYDFTGLSHSELRGSRWLAAFHPDDRREVFERWEHSVRTGEPYEVESRLRRHDGQYRWILGRALPIRDENGRIVHWFGTCTDIHEQKSVERALNATIEVGQKMSNAFETERIVQALTDATTEAIGAEFGTFLYAVPKEGDESLSLYSFAGTGREAFEELPNLRIEPLCLGESTVRSDDVALDPRYRGAPEGHPTVRSYLAVSVRARDGEVLGGLYFGHSEAGRFTEEHERLVESMAAQASIAYENAVLYRRLKEGNEDLERKVVERTAELQASNDALMSFNYHISHDLRAPLRAIVATSRIIQEDFGEALPEEANRLLDRQAEAGNKLGILIDDLLRYSRLSREEIEKRPLDLTRLAAEVANEATAEHPDRDVKVEVMDGLCAVGDSRLVRLAMHNLIENAVKYSPEGGTIRVGCREDGAYFVSDEGIGIEEQYFGRIFEPFQRLHRDVDFRGTGIGLSNVRQIITRHGGTVWVESEPRTGSTFYFTLG